MTNEDIAGVLDGIAGVAEASTAPLASLGIPGIIAGVTAIAFRSAAAFARAGKNPVIEIKRIHDQDPLLQTVRADWEKFIAEHFPKKSEPPPSTATEDIYSEG